MSDKDRSCGGITPWLVETGAGFLGIVLTTSRDPQEARDATASVPWVGGAKGVVPLPGGIAMSPAAEARLREVFARWDEEEGNE
jgi:hypothetical protein